MSKKVLVLNNRGMGDCIISTMAFPYIENIFGDVDIHFGVQSRHAKLFNSDIFEGTFTPFGMDIHSIVGIFSLHKKINELKPDYIIELTPVRRVGKAIRLTKLLNPFLDFKFFSTKGKDIGPLPEELASHSACLQNILNDIWWSLDKDSPLPPSHLNYQQQVKPSGQKIIMSMASSSFDHLYDVGDFSKLINSVKALFPDTEILYPLSRSNVDQTTKHKLERLSAPVTFIETQLDQLPKLFAEAMFFIGMDTGIKHLAVYMGIPTFSFIPKKSYPYSHSYPDPKHKAILLDSKPEDVELQLSNWITDVKNSL